MRLRTSLSPHLKKFWLRPWCSVSNFGFKNFLIYQKLIFYFSLLLRVLKKKFWITQCKTLVKKSFFNHHRVPRCHLWLEVHFSHKKSFAYFIALSGEGVLKWTFSANEICEILRNMRTT
jgi:hypothetical protein